MVLSIRKCTKKYADKHENKRGKGKIDAKSTSFRHISNYIQFHSVIGATLMVHMNPDLR